MSISYEHDIQSQTTTVAFVLFFERDTIRLTRVVCVRVLVQYIVVGGECYQVEGITKRLLMLFLVWLGCFFFPCILYTIVVIVSQRSNHVMYGFLLTLQCLVRTQEVYPSLYY